MDGVAFFFVPGQSEDRAIHRAGDQRAQFIAMPQNAVKAPLGGQGQEVADKFTVEVLAAFIR